MIRRGDCRWADPFGLRDRGPADGQRWSAWAGPSGSDDGGESGVLRRGESEEGGRGSVRAVLRERGAGTVWVVAATALVWVVAVVGVQIGVGRVAWHRAQSAADLGALAAAKWALAHPDSACGRAQHVVEINGASLRSCDASDGVVDVSVALEVSLPGLGVRTITVNAKAGPVDVVSS
ncbi:Rv3654c family TadE-like protein [Acrocarpospora phusangensis]|uniref:Rv3654c family TadE-like protein n=1 Tax=Acrocarpospora phusangensis TaxID=1070424 RepID=UPI0019511D02|nr:Rv3654c family TadE-like protein [Acrocarpospora phusangensis]